MTARIATGISFYPLILLEEIQNQGAIIFVFALTIPSIFIVYLIPAETNQKELDEFLPTSID